MKKILYSIILCVFVLSNAKSAELHDQLSLGLENFINYVTREGVKCPVIVSDYYLTSLEPDAVEVNRLREGREFALELSVQIDKFSEYIYKPDNGLEKNERNARIMIDLAEWVGAENGYGNIILSANIIDISTVAIGRVVVNLDAPLESADALLTRASLSYPTIKERSGCLNMESSGVFPIVNTKEKLAKQWNLGLIDATPSSFFKDVDISELMRKEPRNVGFYLKNKAHGYIALSMGSRNLTDLKSLLLFRHKVGSFPTEFEAMENSPFSGVKGAFERAWRPYRGSTHEMRTVYAAAARCYVAIDSNQFLDEFRMDRVRFQDLK